MDCLYFLIFGVGIWIALRTINCVSMPLGNRHTYARKQNTYTYTNTAMSRISIPRVNFCYQKNIYQYFLSTVIIHTVLHVKCILGSKYVMLISMKIHTRVMCQGLKSFKILKYKTLHNIVCVGFVFSFWNHKWFAWWHVENTTDYRIIINNFIIS